MSPINPNFFYFERPCPICRAPMLIPENELACNRVPCARCVKGGSAVFNDKPVTRLTFEEESDDAHET